MPCYSPANLTIPLNTSHIDNRTKYRTAVHLITGHCGLHKDLHNINKSDFASFVDTRRRLSQSLSDNALLQLNLKGSSSKITTDQLTTWYLWIIISLHPLAGNSSNSWVTRSRAEEGASPKTYFILKVKIKSSTASSPHPTSPILKNRRIGLNLKVTGWYW